MIGINSPEALRDYLKIVEPAEGPFRDAYRAIIGGLRVAISKLEKEEIDKGIELYLKATQKS